MPPPKKNNQSKPLASAITAFNKGDLQQAEKLIQQVLRKNLKMPKALDLLGTILLQQGKNQEAIEPLEKAARALPDDAEVWDHLGVAYMRANEITQAAEAFDKSLKIRPDRPATLNNAGYNLLSLGEYEKSKATLLRALELKPSYKEAHTNLGITLYHMGSQEEALQHFNRSLELAGDDSAETRHNIGCVYRELGQPQTALEHFKKALQLDPDHVKALNSMGMLLKESGKSIRACQCYNKALENQPDNAKVHNNLGGAYKDMNMLDKSVEYYRKALELEPGYTNTHSNLLLCLNYLAHLSREEVYQEHLAFNETLAGQIPELEQDTQRQPEPNKKLRLGIVSGDLRKHSVAYFLWPFLENLDPANYEIFCYYNNTKWDDFTDEFKEKTNGWVQCVHMSNAQLARQIQQDSIDILFDLSGHSGGSQLLTFAARPAPIQVSWIGYPNTTGLKQMDYRLVDAITDPPGDADQYHTEKLIRLPHGFLCYRPPIPEDEVPVRPSPHRQNGYITFGSFNNMAKISPETITMWAEILNAVPGSRLLLKSLFVAETESWNNIIAQLREQGVDSRRIHIEPRTQEQKDHLNLYNRVDIALDTYPYHGTTTTTEALYMGVPVITLAGDRHASRVSASLLSRIGLNELVAEDMDDYVRIARELAEDKKRLDELRAGMRSRLDQSPLRDEEHFTRTVEKALRTMWQRWCEGKAPEVFEVASDKSYDFSNVKAEIPVPEKAPAVRPLDPLGRGGEYTIIIRDGVQVFSAADLNNYTTYVLLEQEDLPGPEIEFVRSLIKPGMSVLDTSPGVYALSAARALNGQGKVAALSSDEYFQKSIQLNGFQELITKETDLEPDFVRLSQDSDYTPQGNPLIMFWDKKQVQGLDTYKLIPGLNALVQSVNGQFACDSNRFADLKFAGLAFDITTDIDHDTTWQSAIKDLPYTQSLFAKWQKQNLPGNYEQALNSYLASRDVSLPLPTRYNLLVQARDILQELEDEHITTTLVLIRVSMDLGDFDQALGIVRELTRAMQSELQIKLDRPFVPPIARFDNREVRGDLGQWLQCSILETLEKLRSDSSYHRPKGHMSLLTQIRQNPNHSLEIDRRLALCALLAGKKINVSLDSPLCQESDEHRNAWFWRELGGEKKTPVVTASPEPKSMGNYQQKSTIRILHQMARGGGTIISRCLGCMQDVILLSEVHPLAMQVAKQYGNTFSPLHQAHRWFGLFSAQEVAELEKEDLGYSKIIQEIQERVVKQGKVLVLRDWSHLDFTGVPFVQSPSYAFSHAKTLAEDFQVIHTATVRHPIDQWLRV